MKKKRRIIYRHTDSDDGLSLGELRKFRRFGSLMILF